MKQYVLVLSVFMGFMLLVGCGNSNAAPASDKIAINSLVAGEDETVGLTETSTNESIQTVDELVPVDTIHNTDIVETGEDISLLSKQDSQPGFGGFKQSTAVPRRSSSVTEYLRIISDLLTETDSHELYSLEGNCLDHSAALLEKLKAKGFDQLMLAQTDDSGGAVELNLSDGTTERAYKKHYFLVDKSNGARSEIIIDPTIYQFIAEKPAEAATKPIFVGKKFDLKNFYARNKAQARHDISDPDSRKIGKYDPDELVCLIYSVDNCSENRKNFEG